MVFDFDDYPDREPPIVTTKSVRGDDLEAIVMLLELAAIYLTQKPRDKFTFDELYNKASEIGGSEIVLDKRDIEIILPYMKTICKCPGKFYMLK